MIPVKLWANCEGLIKIINQTDPGSNSLGSNPGIRFRDVRTMQMFGLVIPNIFNYNSITQGRRRRGGGGSRGSRLEMSFSGK